jgi:hypothetical protein
LSLEFLCDCFFGVRIEILVGLGNFLDFPIFLGTLILDALDLVEFGLTFGFGDALSFRFVFYDCLLCTL